MAEPASPARRRQPLIVLALVAIAMAISAIRPFDWPTWWMEVAPILVAAPILIATYRRFPLTPLVYWLLLVHALILVVGAHWSYAEVPLGFWVKDWLGLDRNHYDRLGHFAQGFIPALVAREVLLRLTPLQRGGWLFFIVASICLAASACYEFIEWWAAVIGGSTADAFLGSQGDIWDAQWDMFMCLCGAILSQLLLRRWHDRQLAALTPMRDARAA
ncbi:MAG: DUF2238 domain-containing protein [Deltaproteobacteria bacterium]|nr:DUF2238 domain-containing protein [Deltaproteobacteria bacterium]